MANALVDRLLGTAAVASAANDVREMSNGRKYKTIDAAAATVVGSYLLWRPKAAVALLSMNIIPSLAATGDNTNHKILTVGVSATDAGSITAYDALALTTGVDFVARTSKAMTIVTATDVIAAGSYLWLTTTIAGGGLALGAFVVEFDWQYQT